MKTAEQQARELLDRIGVEDAHVFSSGELVELANLIDMIGDLEIDAGRYRKLREIAMNNGLSLEGEVAMAALDYTGDIGAFDKAVDRLLARLDDFLDRKRGGRELEVRVDNRA